MNIKILGSGCANCVNLEKAAKKAVSESGIVVDEQVLLSGRVPTSGQVKELLAPLVG